MEQDQNNEEAKRHNQIHLVRGMGIGVALDNIAIGVGVGIALGAAFGLVLPQKGKNKEM